MSVRAAQARVPALRPPGGTKAHPRLLLVVVATTTLLAGALRLFPLLPGGAPGLYPLDYDEGVYSAAAGLFARGDLPYHDFVFVHPPGLLYLLSPLGGLEPATALQAERLVMVLVGMASCALVGVLAGRRWGVAAAAVATAVYATFPEAVHAEHGVFLEPFLTLFSLAAVACWLRTDSPRPIPPRSDSPRGARGSHGWAVAAGVSAGVALTVKLWAVAVVVAILLAPADRDRRSGYARFLLGLLGTVALLWLPLLLPGPSRLFEQVVGFHLGRPEDGVVGLGERLAQIFAGATIVETRHLVAAVLAVAGLFVVFGRSRGDRLGRVAAAWFGITVAMFVMSTTYWPQYNAALAPSMSLLAGAAGSAVASALRRAGPARLMAGLAAAVIVLGLGKAAARSALDGQRRSTEQAAIAADVERLVPRDACVVAFEPGWLIAANRLPLAGPRSVLGVDPYGAHLLLLQREEQHHAPAAGATADDVFARQSVSNGVLDSIAACPYLFQGWRARLQLTTEQEEWIVSHYRQLPTAGPVDLWQRVDPPPSSFARLPF